MYGHYKETHRLWTEAGIGVPPCFIVVRQNTAVSKLVYDFVSGFQCGNDDGSTTFRDGRLPLFSNFNEHKDPPARRQLESGEVLDKVSGRWTSGEIERHRREIVDRTGGRRAESLTEQDLLREAMSTVGKPGRLGDFTVRCVVSVSMPTEGWDASTVIHVLGVRAFGTQLLCEQVIGRPEPPVIRPERRNLSNVEYADVLGIPFDFTAKPGPAPAATRDGAGEGGSSRARRGLPGGAYAGPRRAVHHQERRDHRLGRGPRLGAPGRHAPLDAANAPDQAPAVHQVA